DNRVVDAQAHALAQQRLSQFDEWAVPQIICLRLEAEAEQRNLANTGIENAAGCEAQVRFIAPHDAADHGNLYIVDAGDMHPRRKGMRETGPAEGKTGPKVRRRDV